LVERARDASLEGLAFLYGMPGTVGGALSMNARCYGSEVADVLCSARYLELEDGRWLAREYRMDGGDWGYKKSPFAQPIAPRAEAGLPEAAPPRRVMLSARFSLRLGDRAAIQAEMEAHRADREAKGHYRYPCAGSVFKNNRGFGEPTGKIIDELGLRGLRRGGAMVAEYHGNIIVNSGGASAAEVRALVEELRERVRQARGFELESEVLMVGEF